MMTTTSPLGVELSAAAHGGSGPSGLLTRPRRFASGPWRWAGCCGYADRKLPSKKLVPRTTGMLDQSRKSCIQCPLLGGSFGAGGIHASYNRTRGRPTFPSLLLAAQPHDRQARIVHAGGLERSRFAADTSACPERATWKIRDEQ